MNNICKCCENEFIVGKKYDDNYDKLCEECYEDNGVCELCDRSFEKDDMFSSDDIFSAEYDANGKAIKDATFPEWDCCYKCADKLNYDVVLIEKVIYNADLKCLME